MLQEFKNDIYPRRLWVATSWEDAKDKFASDYEIKESEGNFATTYPRVKHKGNRRLGVLIVFNIGENEGGSAIVGTIAHESVHAANFIFDDLGIQYDLVNDEHAAYTVGWVAKCCWKALQKEIYKKKKDDRQ